VLCADALAKSIPQKRQRGSHSASRDIRPDDREAV
jgi:hypothetical protein